MSMYRARGKHKKVVKVGLTQPKFWTGYGTRTVTLTDIIDNSTHFQDYKSSHWDSIAWKNLDGKDMTLYFTRKNELEQFLSCFTGCNPDNHYYKELQDTRTRLYTLGTNLDKICTDITKIGQRSKLFMKYEAPSIVVDK